VHRAGVEVSERVVRRILRSANLLAVRKRKFKALADCQHNFTIYANIVQYLVVSQINQLWVADLPERS
jgi:hypothetical protein